MNQDLAKWLGDLETLLNSYDRLRPPHREPADLAICYRISQVERLDVQIAQQYRNRYQKLTEESK